MMTAGVDFKSGVQFTLIPIRPSRAPGRRPELHTAPALHTTGASSSVGFRRHPRGEPRVSPAFCPRKGKITGSHDLLQLSVLSQESTGCEFKIQHLPAAKSKIRTENHMSA